MKLKTVLSTHLLIPAILIFLILIATSVFSQTKKILLIGDSITESWGESTPQQPTWRRNLDHLLTAASVNFDFIGNKTTLFNNKTPNQSDYDWNHQGHWGQNVGYFLQSGRLSSWINDPGYDFDMVLMHLGTNNAFDGDPVATTISELGAVIDLLRTDNPTVTLFIAQVIPSSNPTRNANIDLLNAQIPVLAASKNTAISPVIVVDQNTGFDAVTDTYDGTHPDNSGVVKIAQKWFDAVSATILDVSWGEIDFKIQNQSLLLNWETLSERNNKGFTIQFKDSDTFQDLAFVEGKGNTSTLNQYQYRSGILPQGQYVFRIQQEDFDGQLSYSSMFEVNISQGFNMPVWVYPNPTSQELWVDLPEDFRKKLNIELIDLSGRRVYSSFFETAESRVQLPLPKSLAKGYYQMYIKNPENRQALLLKIE